MIKENKHLKTQEVMNLLNFMHFNLSEYYFQYKLIFLTNVTFSHVLLIKYLNKTINMYLQQVVFNIYHIFRILYLLIILHHLSIKI